MKIKEAFRVGVSFGLTSGAITTMGLMVGLYSGTQFLKAVVGGVLTIAIADAFSDALGIHIHEESENEHTPKEIWQSTIATFVSKFIFAISFLIPLGLFNLRTAIVMSMLWGLSLVAIISYLIARDQKIAPYRIIGEHVLIAAAVILITHGVGQWIYRVINY